MRNIMIFFIMTCVMMRNEVAGSVDLNVLALVRPSRVGMDINEVGSIVTLVRKRIEHENLLPQHFNIVVHYRETCTIREGASGPVDAVREYVLAMYQLQVVQNKTVHMIYGPHCSDGMKLVAKLAAFENIPVMGYLSIDESLTDKTIYTTLTRTSSSGSKKLSKSFLLILKKYNWLNVAVLTNIQQRVLPGFTKDLKQAAKRGEIQIMREMNLTKIQLLNQSLISDTLKIMRNDSNVIIINIDFTPCEAFATNVWEVIGRDGHITPDVLFLVPMYSGVSTETCSWNTTLFKNTILIQPADPGDAENQVKIRQMWIDANLNVDYIKRIQHQAAMFNAMYLWALAISEIWNTTMGNISALTNGVAVRQINCCRLFNGMIGVGRMDEKGELIARHSVFVLNENGDQVQVLRVNPVVINADCSQFKYEKEVHLAELTRDINGKYWFRENLSLPSFDPPPCGYENSKCPPIPEEYTVFAVVMGSLFFIVTSIVALILYQKRMDDIRKKAVPWLLDSDHFSELISNQSRNSIDRASGSINRLSLNGPDKTINEEGSSILMMYKTNTIRIWPEIVKKTPHFETSMIANLNEVYNLSHESVSKFLGVSFNQNTSEVFLCFTNYDRGFLTETVFNKNLKLGVAFKTSFIKDIMKGLDYLHTNQVCHGSLSLDTCLVNRNWNVRISGYGMTPFKQSLKASDTLGSYRVSTDRLLATAPELLSEWLGKAEEHNPIGCSHSADLYSLGMCMYQILYREQPFIHKDKQPVEVTIELIAKGQLRAEHLQSFVNQPKNKHRSFALVNDVIKDLLRVRPEQRPRLKIVEKALRAVFKETHSGNIIDHMIAMMDSYANNLEKLVLERTGMLEESQRRAEMLLHQMLPKNVVNVADNLTAGVAVPPQMFESATVCFTDIVGFTSICSYSTPMQVVTLLNTLYSDFDHVIDQFNVYKVETIGDAYMLVSGVPEPNPHGHATSVAEVAVRMRMAAESMVVEHMPEVKMMIRVGIGSGPVAAGVVGLQAPRYCLFGDTVNKASRMESTSMPMKIQIDTPTADLLKKTNKFHIEYRGKIEVKGKDEMDTHWLMGCTS